MPAKVRLYSEKSCPEVMKELFALFLQNEAKKSSLSDEQKHLVIKFQMEAVIYSFKNEFMLGKTNL